MNVSFYLNFIEISTKNLMKCNPHYVFFYTLLRYLVFRLKRFFKENHKFIALPEERMKQLLIKESIKFQTCSMDDNSCVLVNLKNFKTFHKIYICSKLTFQKYKLLALPSEDIGYNSVCLSKSMRFNVENMLGHSDLDDSVFIMLSNAKEMEFATEARVSLINPPQGCSFCLTDTLLENYFHEPRFLRTNDVFKINIREYAYECTYSIINQFPSSLYFKVNILKINNKMNYHGCYIILETTNLIQETNMHCYFPRECFGVSIKDAHNCPPPLEKSLQHLEYCIRPFIENNIQLKVKPIFLIKATVGCGKNKLIQLVAEKWGFNLIIGDFAEMQTLTSAQTEAKMRTVFHNALNSTPCLLCLTNIQVFGRNSEGQKDERIISAFTDELTSLYAKKSQYPVIVIATSDGSDILAELQRIFIETIHIEPLDQSNRANFISWLLLKKGVNYQADLSKIAGLCSDFKFVDLIALTNLAIKIHYKSMTNKHEISLTLNQEDFFQAHEYIQSICTNCKDIPNIPKVHWEDIGGLADLKHEIKRRIQLPLINKFGLKKSGLLLFGPPGTGKTLLAKAVATEFQFHFLSIKGPEVLNMYVGQSEKNVRQIFEQARAATPCIIFFDELDSLAPNRGRSGDSGGVMDRVVSQLLAEMDGLEDSSRIFIIAATNRPDLIDPALLRPGRFDKMLYVGTHNSPESQLSVLKALTRKFSLSEKDKNFEKLLPILPKNLSGADLYGICSDSWLRAARRILCTLDEFNDENIDPLTVTVELQDFVEATNNLIPSIGKEEMEQYKQIKTNLSK